MFFYNRAVQIAPRSPLSQPEFPLKLRCRIHFDLGVLFCAQRCAAAKAEPYSAFSRQLSGSVVLGPRPFISNRDTSKRISIGVRVPRSRFVAPKQRYFRLGLCPTLASLRNWCEITSVSGVPAFASANLSHRLSRHLMQAGSYSGTGPKQFRKCQIAFWGYATAGL